jgi:peroxiredoxin
MIRGMRADLVPGAPFPDIQLPDWQGKMQKLSDLQGHDPTVLVFYRGLY